MSADDLDATINQLYRERKAQIDAPTITFDETEQNKEKRGAKYWSKSLMILSGGGLISFGILALVTHLATSPKTQSLPTLLEGIEVDIVETVSIADTMPVTIVRAPLPPKPPAIKEYARHTVTFDDQLTKMSSTLGDGTVNIISLPTLQTQSTEMKPVYKVMPSYPKGSIINKQAGKITLSYSINAKGKTENIEVVASSVDVSLQKSARQALSQWQFKPTSKVHTKQEVEFEFTLDAGL